MGGVVEITANRGHIDVKHLEIRHHPTPYLKNLAVIQPGGGSVYHRPVIPPGILNRVSVKIQIDCILRGRTASQGLSRRNPDIPGGKDRDVFIGGPGKSAGYREIAVQSRIPVKGSCAQQLRQQYFLYSHEAIRSGMDTIGPIHGRHLNQAEQRSVYLPLESGGAAFRQVEDPGHIVG